MGHRVNQAPRLLVKLSDEKDSILHCDSKFFAIGAEGSSTFKTGTDEGPVGSWRYKDWTPVKLNLTPYIGKAITIEFITTDCFPSYPMPTPVVDTACEIPMPGSHAAYAYIDMYCEPYKPAQIFACATQDSMQICAPDGYASYDWPTNQTGMQPPFNKQCVTVKGIKIGDVYTVNLTSYEGACTTPATITIKGNDFTLSRIQRFARQIQYN